MATCRLNAPEIVVPPSSFTGVHGLAVDRRARLLAGSVVGNAIWEADRNTGAAKVLVDRPEGQADDIAIGPNFELAWTNYLMGMLRYRENDAAPMRVLAKDLAGLNSLDFDRRNGKLYASQVFLGDALSEIDVAGAKPPRLIGKDLGGRNGFPYLKPVTVLVPTGNLAAAVAVFAGDVGLRAIVDEEPRSDRNRANDGDRRPSRKPTDRFTVAESAFPCLVVDSLEADLVVLAPAMTPE